MPLDTDYLGEWRRLDGSTSPDQRLEPDIVFGHVSDLHGQLSAAHQVYYNNPRSRVGLDFDGEDRRIERGGGVPLLTAKLDQLRSAADGDVVALMSGDTFHGTAVTTYTDGRAMLDPINDHLRPDVYVPGNWDFSNEANDEGSFRSLMDALDAPVVANNLYDWETKELLFDPFILLDIDNITVGVVGMTNVYVDRMAPAFHAGKYRFGKHPALLAEASEAAREDGADVVVAVTEIGLPWMVQAAKDIDSIDVMFSAHTHEYTHDPIVIEDTGTVIVESGMGEALGRVDLHVDEDAIAFRHHLYCLVEATEYTPDPDSAARETVETVRAPFFGADVNHERGAGTLERSLDTVIGKTEQPLYRQAFLESGWNTLFNDALREHFDADLAVSHGFRYGTAIPRGEITLEQLYTFFPMTAPVARGVAVGQQIRNHMEDFLIDNFTPYVYDQEDGRLRNYSSNVEVIVDPTAKRNRRLVDLLLDGESMDPEEMYSVATFHRPGDPERDLGGCGFPFREVQIESDTIPVDVIEDFLDEHSPVAYDVRGLVRTPEDGGDVQNTPADGAYPYIQPGVDYAEGREYTETRLIPGEYVFPDAGRNQFR